MAWWVIYLTLRGKIIDLNNFKTDILDDAIDQSRIESEYTRYVERELINTKEFSHEKWDQLEDSIYNYLTSRENIHGVPLYYVIRKDKPSPEDSENRYVQIIYQASLVGNVFTRDSRKVLDIIKEPTLGTDTETWIKYLTCGRKTMQ